DVLKLLEPRHMDRSPSPTARLDIVYFPARITVRSTTMKKLSSDFTVFHKRVFPVLWFGFLVLFVVAGLAHGVAGANPMFLVIPFAMAAFGYFLMKKLVWDLVDEVYDGGDYLVVRNRGEESQIPLSAIVNVSVATMINP